MSFGDDILSMRLQAKYQSPVRWTICPVCAFPVEDTERGLHCKNCGWREYPTMRYIPRTPESPST